MRPTLVFTAGDDWFELLVRFGTFCPASHAAIGIGPNLLHVHDAGVVLEPRERWLKDDQRLIAEFEILPDVRWEITKLGPQLGRPYDLAGALGIAARRGLRAIGSPLGQILTVAPKRTCAAFVMQIDPCGFKIPEWRNLRLDVVAPADLLRATGPSFRRIA